MALILQFSRTYIALIFVMAIMFTTSQIALPRFARSIYQALLIITLPFVLLLSECMLMMIYYFVVTPIGLALRIGGHHALSLRSDRTARTYWKKLISPSDVQRYYRQS